MFNFSYGSQFNIHVRFFFIIIEMYICLASQTDVNQTVHTSLTTKRNVVKIIDCKGKY